MSNEETADRILRPRQFVPITEHMRDADEGGDLSWPHPELAYIAQRLRQMMFTEGALKSERDRETFDRIEALLVYARDYFGWWLERMDADRLLPDAACRPTPEEVVGKMPSWELFILLIGALHRAGAWVEAKGQQAGDNRPRIADVIAAAYGLMDSEGGQV